MVLKVCSVLSETDACECSMFLLRWLLDISCQFRIEMSGEWHI